MVICRLSYAIRAHEVGSTEYQKAIFQNILKTRSADEVFLITSSINLGQNAFIPLDKTFVPFDLPSLLAQNGKSSFSHDFISLSDPVLEEMIC